MTITQYIPSIRSFDEMAEFQFPEDSGSDRLRPMDDRVLHFLQILAERILQTASLRADQEFVALAYWLRQANLRHYADTFLGRVGPEQVVLPRGRAFHVAAANVGSNFLYSWALSLLAGNINVVRISKSTSPGVLDLLGVLRQLCEDPVGRPITARNAILSYPHSDQISAQFSAWADVRVLWGGDDTVQYFRRLPAKPTVKDLAFADKCSFTCIEAPSYLAASGAEVVRVAHQFYNDAYWFDQMACSSPRLVYFVGNPEECDLASQGFWREIEVELKRREHMDSASVAINKLVYACECAGELGPLVPVRIGNGRAPTVLRIDCVNRRPSGCHCGGGVFLEAFLPELSSLLPLIEVHDQTMTYFGFSVETIQGFARSLTNSGLHRIVPIGQAMNFGPTWDGYMLLDELTRRVVVI